MDQARMRHILDAGPVTNQLIGEHLPLITQRIVLGGGQQSPYGQRPDIRDADRTQLCQGLRRAIPHPLANTPGQLRDRQSPAVGFVPHAGLAEAEIRIRIGQKQYLRLRRASGEGGGREEGYQPAGTVAARPARPACSGPSSCGADAAHCTAWTTSSTAAGAGCSGASR